MPPAQCGPASRFPLFCSQDQKVLLVMWKVPMHVHLSARNLERLFVNTGQRHFV